MGNNPLRLWRQSWFRPLAPGETDPERIIGWLFPVIVGLIAGWMVLGLPLPKCPLHELTGIPCVSCGGTRALGALVRGEWLLALRWNPGVLLSGLFLALVWVYSMMVWVLQWHRFRPALSPRVQHGLRVLFFLLLAANWLYLLVLLP